VTTMKEVAECFTTDTWQTAREAGATSFLGYGGPLQDATAKRLLDRRPAPRDAMPTRWEYRRAS